MRLFILLLALGLPGPCLAHDWYTNMRDPVFNSVNCCSGDCGEVPIETVTPLSNGYRLQLSGAQASQLTPSATLPVDAFIPMSRVQDVPRGKKGAYHACIMGNDRTPPRGGVRCFFASPMM